MSGFDFVVAGIEKRYDYLSARTMAKEAVSAAGLKQQDKYSGPELQKIVDALAGLGSNLDSVYSALGVAPSGEPAPAPPAPAKDDKKDESKKDDKSDKKDDKKESDKKDDKSDKKDDKKESDKKDDKSDKKDDKSDKKDDDKKKK